MRSQRDQPNVFCGVHLWHVSGRSDASRPQKCMMRYLRALTLSGFLFRDRPRTKGALPPWTPQAWAAAHTKTSKSLVTQRTGGAPKYAG